MHLNCHMNINLVLDNISMYNINTWGIRSIRLFVECVECVSYIGMLAHSFINRHGSISRGDSRST